MQINKNQKAFVIFFGTVICAILLVYNAFYNPQAQEIKYIPMTSSEIIENSKLSVNNHFKGNRLNINLATAEEISENIEGIGLTLAQKIVEYRTENGAFKEIAEIKNVKGIGDKKYETIKEKICI